ncbi:MAG: MarR family winged helix-turn-helix transcriptional regulator [Candidatus Omnitrophica bacterium]|nr:MarR family winged helix-turn-helix transcriptional regulator [Candidatus Omnitrophota bacterium]
MSAIDELTNEIAVMVPKLIKGAKNDFLTKANISTAQMIMLMSIHDHGECKIKTLAKERSISPPTATGLITRLVASGYVKRGSDAEDRRVVMVSLTKKGENMACGFLDTIKKRWKNILIHLTAKEQQQYLNIVKKIVSILSGEENGPK